MTKSRSCTVFLRLGSLECDRVAIASDSQTTSAETDRIRNDSNLRTTNWPSYRASFALYWQDRNDGAALLRFFQPSAHISSSLQWCERGLLMRLQHQQLLQPASVKIDRCTI